MDATWLPWPYGSGSAMRGCCSSEIKDVNFAPLSTMATNADRSTPPTQPVPSRPLPSCTKSIAWRTRVGVWRPSKLLPDTLWWL